MEKIHKRPEGNVCCESFVLVSLFPEEMSFILSEFLEFQMGLRKAWVMMGAIRRGWKSAFGSASGEVVKISYNVIV